MSITETRKLNIAADSRHPIGIIEAPPSKSILNRIILIASLASGESIIHGFCPGRCAGDVGLMRNALGALGVGSNFQHGGLHISGARFHNPSGPIQVGAAGTALRFLLPLAALHCNGPVKFIGSERLFERPLGPLLDALGAAGAVWRPEPGGGLLIPPETAPKFLDLEIDGSSSSQFISGMAMAMAGLPGGGVLRWARPLVSHGYLALTKLCLERFKCQARLNEATFKIPGGFLGPVSTRVSGDWSAAAIFFCAAAILGREIVLHPLDPEDGQPDSEILPILEKTGSTWRFEGNRCYFNGCLNTGINADLINCPDLAPILAATAALAPGISELKGLNTLPHKECDRLRASINLVRWLGGEGEELPGFALRVHPAASTKSGPLDGPFDPMDDHRMAFAAALGGLRKGGAVLNPACVFKSFPGFWEIIERL